MVSSGAEKPSIQALERATGSGATDHGKLVRGCQSTDQRPGTRNLLAALPVTIGLTQTKTTVLKRREECLRFRAQMVAETPADRPGHVISDNDGTHQQCAAGLAAPPQVHCHFTPTSARGLHPVESWFGILTRKARRGASFKHVTEWHQASAAFIAAHNPKAKPFQGRKREVNGSQSRNTIMNLRS